MTLIPFSRSQEVVDLILVCRFWRDNFLYAKYHRLIILTSSNYKPLTIPVEPMFGISPNLHGYIIETNLRVDKVLVTLTLFSRSLEDLTI